MKVKDIIRKYIKEGKGGNYIRMLSKKHPNILKHIRKLQNTFGSDSECTYAFLNDLKERPKCKVCGKEVHYFGVHTGYAECCSTKCRSNYKPNRDKYKESCFKHYGVSHPWKVKAIRDNIKHTMKKRYGAEYSMNSPRIKEKIENTQLKRYGATNQFSSTSFKKKRKATNMERYGVAECLSNTSIRKKIKETCIKNYGVDNPFKDKKIRNKIKNTMIEKYGKPYTLQNKKLKEKYQRTMRRKYDGKSPFECEGILESIEEKYGTRYPMQNVDVLQYQRKKAHQYKSFKVQGKTFEYQGYEDQAIKYFVKLGIPVKDIHYRKVPIFKYKLKGKEHTYFPDLYVKIKGYWWVVEVKSPYTIGLKDFSIWKKVKAKAHSVIDAGYKFAFIVFDAKGNETIINKKIKQLTRKTILLKTYQ
jgi:hypothetical protein